MMHGNAHISGFNYVSSIMGLLCTLIATYVTMRYVLQNVNLVYDI